MPLQITESDHLYFECIPCSCCCFGYPQEWFKKEEGLSFTYICISADDHHEREAEGEEAILVKQNPAADDEQEGGNFGEHTLSIAQTNTRDVFKSCTASADQAVVYNP